MSIKLTNKNYCATIVKITKLIDLDNCDNVIHANIFGNLVVVSKDTKVDDVGIFFPVECKLSDEYLSKNNLFRHSEKNVDTTKVGYFEDNGRIKAVKFRGNTSNGLFMPLSSLNFLQTKENLCLGSEFNEIDNVNICEKYIVKRREPSGQNSAKSKEKLESKVIEGQFNLHYDTEQLGKFTRLIKPDSLISITSKFHGTSAVVSNALVKKQLNLFEKLLKFLKVNIVDTEYNMLYSSRRVIKNEFFINKDTSGFYDEDIWGITANKIYPFITKGMSVYYEIVGFTPSGQQIQKDYDYGCESNQHEIYIYRITNTNADGAVHEFSAKQVQEWCENNGFKSVVELYYGYAKDLFSDIAQDKDFGDIFVDKLREKYLEKQCTVCKNKVPNEGIVLRVDELGSRALKLKSFAFLQKETKDLDKGNIDMEEEN